MKILSLLALLFFLLSCGDDLKEKQSAEAAKKYSDQIQQIRKDVSRDSAFHAWARQMRSVLRETGYSWQETEWIIDSTYDEIYSGMSSTDSDFNRWFIDHQARRKKFRDSTLPKMMKEF